MAGRIISSGAGPGIADGLKKMKKHHIIWLEISIQAVERIKLPEQKTGQS